MAIALPSLSNSSRWCALRRSRIVLLATAGLITLLMWILLWRYPVWSWDEFGFRLRVLQDPQRFGSFLQCSSIDINTRNGRLADCVGQYLFSQGLGVTHAALAVLCWTVGWLAFIWVCRPGRPPRVSARMEMTVLVVCQLLPLIAIVGDYQLGGSSLFFMAATVNYMGGLLLFLVATPPVLRRLSGRAVPGWRLLLSFFLMVFASLFHESVSTMVFGICLIPWISRRFRAGMSPPFLASTAVVAVVGLARLSAPGLWARRATMKKGGTNPLMMLDTVVRGADAVARFDGMFVVAAVAGVLLGVLGAQGPARGQKRLGLSLSIATLLWWGFSRGVPELAYRDDVVFSRHVTAVPAALSAVFVVYSGTALLVRRPKPEYFSLAGWLSVWFGMCLAIAMGTGHGRDHYFGLYMALLFLVGVVHDTAGACGSRERSKRILCALFLASCVVTGAVGFGRSWGDQRANSAAWVSVQRDIDAVHEGASNTVTVPSHVPYPWGTPQWVGQFPSVGQEIRLLYQLPPGVEVVVR